MSEMIDRVAIAMEQKRADLINQPLARIWKGLAEAAILAMREPTKEMIEEGHRADPLSCDVEKSQIEYCYGEMWRAMIDAAISSD